MQIYEVLQEKEYIERGALINRLEVSPLLKPTFSFGENTRNGIIDLVKKQPTADVVEVVRCKDCKYYEPKNSLGTQGVCMCGEKDMNYSGEFYPYENDFCSYGERKDK